MQDESGGITNAVSGTVIIQNTIVAGNTAVGNGGAADFFGAATSLGNNLIGDTSGSNGWLVSDLQNIDPHLGPLGNNGGATRTHALFTASLAIDAGNNAGSPEPINGVRCFPGLSMGRSTSALLNAHCCISS